MSSLLLSGMWACLLASCYPHHPAASESSVPSAAIRADTVSEPGPSCILIFQDRNNHYWFGSDGQGVYRYDGKHLIHFSSKNGLPHDRIRGIQEDDRGDIYFTTLGGTGRFDGQAFSTLPVAATGSDWKSGPGDLWFATNQDENGAYRYDGKSLYHLEFPKHYLADEFYRLVPNAPYNPYQVYTIYKDRSGNIWFGTSTFGICRFDGRSLSWMYEKHLTQIGDEGSFGIRSIIEDHDGVFWFSNTRYRFRIRRDDSIGAAHRFIRYKRENGTGRIQSPPGDPLYFMSVIEDDGHELWMATYANGVWRYNPSTGRTTQYEIRDGATDVKLYSVYKDRQGVIWLGTHNAGVFRFNGKTFEKFSANASTAR